MDFGDILDKWEKGRSPPGEESRRTTGKGEPPAPVKNPPSPDPLTAWLRLNPVYDKDAEVQERTAGAGERRRRLLRKKPEAVLDLHGLVQEDAWDALELFFQDSRRQGFEKILIIHGKGNHSERDTTAAGESPLKKLTARFIENCPFAGESGVSPAAGGGSGATWVILKNSNRKGGFSVPGK